jgi:2-polyprenyl-3-methyl-5-hydroxy-6-metoxy-1,4-benzoquinol methylase
MIAKDDEYRLKFIAKRCKGKVLDVGCGKAELKNYLNEGQEYFGIDLIYPTTCDVSYEQFPFEDKTFDTVVISEVLEHLENPTHALKECRRVLKDDGLLLGSIPNIETLGRIGLWHIKRIERADQSEHIVAFGSIELNNILRHTGFQPTIFKHLYFYPRWLGSKWIFFTGAKQ